jgi:hypothetical protein
VLKKTGEQEKNYQKMKMFPSSRFRSYSTSIVRKQSFVHSLPFTSFLRSFTLALSALSSGAETLTLGLENGGMLQPK